MELKLIKQTQCECGAEVVEESCRRRHVNGQGFERRTFACGRILAWSPNFRRLEEEQQCPNDPVVKYQEQERSDMEALLFATLRKAQIHTNAKVYWSKRISWNISAFADHDFSKPTPNE